MFACCLSISTNKMLLKPQNSLIALSILQRPAILFFLSFFIQSAFLCVRNLVYVYCKVCVCVCRLAHIWRVEATGTLMGSIDKVFELPDRAIQTNFENLSERSLTKFRTL